MISTAERARGRWSEILQNFGMDPRHLRNKKGPCPLCGGKDRFRFDDKNGNGSYYCEQCGPGSGLKLAAEFTCMPYPQVSREIDKLIGVEAPVPQPAQTQRDPRTALRNLARRCERLGDRISPVRLYLRSRKLSPSILTQMVASQAYWDDGVKVGEYPAMVHLVVDAEGNPATYHVTYLTERGEKAPVDCPRKLMTPVKDWQGGAVRLCEAGGEEIGIAEGIETALAATQMFGVPTWAAINAGNLERFVPPAGTRTVHIYADNDASYTGQASAYTLARRLVTRDHIEAIVHIPDEVNTDWADHLGERDQCSA